MHEAKVDSPFLASQISRRFFFSLSCHLQVFLDLWRTFFCLAGSFLARAQQLQQVLKSFSNLGTKLTSILEEKHSESWQCLQEVKWDALPQQDKLHCLYLSLVPLYSPNPRKQADTNYSTKKNFHLVLNTVPVFAQHRVLSSSGWFDWQWF